jgi:long-chain acyl-CoA synthetase
MFERLIEELCFSVGAGVGFFGGDITKIFEDINVLKPTLFVSVPRIYTRLSDRIRDSVQKQGFLRRALFDFALWTKKRCLRQNVTQHWLWDRLVFSKLRALVGGRVRIMVSGAAPLSEEVMTFLRCSFSCLVLEGYGQTECAAAALATMPGDCSVGHVGPPLPCVEVKLVDVPDMMYFSSDMPRPRGEVCFRGPVLFSGYLKQASESPVDKDGWLHSGDIGQWNPNGTLSIIDRRKNIFKLAQGEYVAPERVEGVYARSEFVAQIFVTGNSLEASLVAVVVPNEEAAMAFARSNGLPADNLKQLCADHTFKEAVMFDLRTHAARAGLKGFECVADVALTTNAFSIDNGILTPTYKVKRPVANRIFQREIAAMYAKAAK